jgi:hypothetical protein
MKKMRILFPYSTGPDVTSFYSLFFENILPELKKTIDVKVIWVVYQAEKNIITKIIDDVDVKYIQDYSDALAVLKQEQPDILFSFPWPDFMAYSFSLAAKSLDIPTFSILFSHTYQERTHKQTIKNYVTRFFEKSIPTDSSKNKKQFMRRGRFFLKKYKFLMNTQKSLGFNFFRIIKDFCMLIKLLLLETNGIIDSRFATSVHFAVGENIIQAYADKGFKRSSIIPTGNPAYDLTFKRFLQQKNDHDQNLHVLFAPSTLYESGFWTKQQNHFVVTEIVKIFSKEKDIKLTVKLHPSTARFSDYDSLIHSIDDSINLVQKGDIRNFLENSDIYLSSETSTGEFFAVIARIPIIICKFFNEPDENILVQNKVAKLCTNPNDLINIIKNLKTEPISETDRYEFIRTYLYKDDGCASERIANELVKLINN